MISDRKMNPSKLTFHVETRHAVPPKMESVRYAIIADTDEPDHRLELLYESVKRFATVFNTVARSTAIRGGLRRKEALT